MIITSFYGMEFKPEIKTQRAYEKKRQAAIELLGNKYLLAEPLTKKESKNEKHHPAYGGIVKYNG